MLSISSELTLKEGYEKFVQDGDLEAEIPWIVQMFEHPRSPLSFPGSLPLFEHDCIHVLCGRNKSLYDEAFVIGMTMGNDRSTGWLHLFLFKVIAQFLYPKQYRFNPEHLIAFDLGFNYGRRVLKKFHDCNIKDLLNHPIQQLRHTFGIDIAELSMLYKVEGLLS